MWHDADLHQEEGNQIAKTSLRNAADKAPLNSAQLRSGE